MRASLYRYRTSLTGPVSWKLGSMEREGREHQITSPWKRPYYQAGPDKHEPNQTCFALHVHGLPCSRLSTSSGLCRLSNRQPPQAAMRPAVPYCRSPAGRHSKTPPSHPISIMPSLALAVQSSSTEHRRTHRQRRQRHRQRKSRQAQSGLGPE